jgi:alpha-glucoside transport system permease protein
VPFWNNFFLMVVLIWIQTGFAMVILSAALRGIPEETVEAAIVDGANPFQIFFKIKIPQIAGTIVVVWTTITHRGAEGLRHRLRHDQRAMGDAGPRQLHV